MGKVWRRPSAYGPVPPSPVTAAACVDVHAEGRRLAVAGVHPRDIADPGLLGAVGHARGELAEDRVVRLLLDPARRPTWLVSATRTERNGVDDRCGVDVVVGTADRGDLHLQVKASLQQVRKFKRKRARAHAGEGNAAEVEVVLADPADSDAVVQARAVSALCALRSRCPR